MYPKHSVTLLILLAVMLPAPSARAGGVVTICDEAHLRAALAGGGKVTFGCSGTIILASQIDIASDTTLDGAGQNVIISGNDAVRVFTVQSGTLNLNQLTIASGFVIGDAGGILNHGTLTVSNSTFSGNIASAGCGGGIFNDGTLNVSDSVFSDNSANIGGGICNVGTLTVSNSNFADNSALVGGGIGNSLSVVTVGNSTFARNSALQGGGIANDGTLNVSNSTFVGNNAGVAGGGGINSFGALNVSNSTFFGNTTGSQGGGVSGNGTVVISNSTFSGNGASQGGGIHQWSGSLTLKNTIIANSLAGGNCSGTITDGGGNLSYPDTTCPGINADPVLGPLQNNGGPTWTMVLGQGSAAIDAGDDSICAAPPVNNLDQRGISRPQGLHCDIGAVEQVLGPTAVTLTILSTQSQPGPVSPASVAGLLLLVLVGLGISRCRTLTLLPE